MAIDVTRAFQGNVVGPIGVDLAAHRVLSYCTEPLSGWGVYDLMGIHARKQGKFDMVDASTLLLANAINGQVSLSNLAHFDKSKRGEFATQLARVPASANLKELDSVGIDAVVDVCSYGFPGVWGPKITKVAALFRPGAVPMLDGYVGLAFGFGAEAFSAAAVQQGMARRDRIDSVVRALASWLRENQRVITTLRARTEPSIPELGSAPAGRQTARRPDGHTGQLPHVTGSGAPAS